jgi:RimJ/RimL family protein N-acetyltransferase
MPVILEPFSLRHIVTQFREFNSAAKKERARLTPYFWWARANDFSRFNFILSGLITEKFAYIMRELPHNKKFIIRHNDEFAGIIGLDGAAQNAPRAEVWYFVTANNERQHVASRALKEIEFFAQNKSIDKIYAYTARYNQESQNLLARSGYTQYYSTRYGLEHPRTLLMWGKYLSHKNY